MRFVLVLWLLSLNLKMSSDSETNEALSFAESSDGSEVLRKIGRL